MKTPCGGILNFQLDTFHMDNSKTNNFKQQILEAIGSTDDSEDAMENLIKFFKGMKFIASSFIFSCNCSTVVRGGRDFFKMDRKAHAKN